MRVNHPWKFIEREMTARWLTPATMAEQISQPLEVVQSILGTTSPVTVEFAIALEKAWSMEAEIWTNWQLKFDLQEARKA